MAKKVMLWPSARSKFVKESNMKIILNTLLVISFFAVISNYYMYSFMYGIKFLLMVVISLIAVKETEILFYTHDKDINRQEAKELIKKSYPAITALIYVLLIPVGVPLWLVALGAMLATFLGKLMFGGFAHMIFHASLVGVIFVTLGWTQLINGAVFSTGFDNDFMELLFNNSFFVDTLSIGNVYAPEAVTSLEMLFNGDMYDSLRIYLGLAPGIIGNGILLIGVLIFFFYKKVINWRLPVITIGSFLITAMIIGLLNDFDIMYPVYQLFSGAFLFVVIFVTGDPITTPIPTKGKIIFGIIAGSLTMIIRSAGKYDEGVIFAVLFMSMLTPMLNDIFKLKKKPIKKAPVKEGA